METTDDFKSLVEIALREDLGDFENNKTGYIGDITSKSTVKENEVITTSMVSRENGVLTGIPIAEYVFNLVDKNLKITSHLKDGDIVSVGDKIITISGNAHSILKAERTALNFLTHLSGIATETARYVDAVKHTDTIILDTRKTLPGWRVLQKHAVKMGGGQNHRMGLYDMVLIKDNHIAAAGGVNNALSAVRKENLQIDIEIEVDTLEQLQEVLDHGTANFVLLDNMRGADLEKAIALCKGKIKTEASGGINFETIKGIAESGVDYISIGALTHSVKVFDIGLDISE